MTTGARAAGPVAGRRSTPRPSATRALLWTLAALAVLAALLAYAPSAAQAKLSRDPCPMADAALALRSGGGPSASPRWSSSSGTA